jgi:hypothetical protein
MLPPAFPNPNPHCVPQGYHCAVFAFGQTGSGKTHSMTGTPADPGVVPRFVHELFAQLLKRQVANKLAHVAAAAAAAEGGERPAVGSYAWSLEATMLEVCPNEKLRDLLALHSEPTSQLLIHKDASLGCTVVPRATRLHFRSADALLEAVRAGESLRVTAPTLLNEHSSRTHVVLQLRLTQARVSLPPRLASPRLSHARTFGSSTHTTHRRCGIVSRLVCAKKSLPTTTAPSFVEQDHRLDLLERHLLTTGTALLGEQENVLLDDKIPQRLTAVVNLVDLAGSERAKRAGTLQNNTQARTLLPCPLPYARSSVFHESSRLVL